MFEFRQILIIFFYISLILTTIKDSNAFYNSFRISNKDISLLNRLIDADVNDNNRTLAITSNKGNVYETLFLNQNGTIHTFEKNRSNRKLISQSIIQNTFLPNNYPTKIPPNYLKYVFFSSLQDLSTQLRSVLATQRILEGMGVGSAEATPLSASLNFIVRDGIGMITSLIFTYITSNKFKSDVKRWRIFADLIINVGLTLEISAMLVPKKLFLTMICLGNMCKAMCGVAAGSCGSVFNLYWAKGTGDISDINAKFGAQNTVTGGLGLIFAVLFVKSLSSASPYVVWSLYAFLTFVHIYANMKLMKLVIFNYLNLTRFNILLNNFFSGLSEEMSCNRYFREHFKRITTLEVPPPTPSVVAKVEPLFWIRPQIRPPLPIRFGLSFHEFIEKSLSCNGSLTPILRRFETDGYGITITTSNQLLRRSTYTILVSFGNHITSIQKVKAYFHAWILGQIIKGEAKKSKSLNIENILSNAKYLIDDVLWEHFYNYTNTLGWDLLQTDIRNENYKVEIVQGNLKTDENVSS